MKPHLGIPAAQPLKSREESLARDPFESPVKSLLESLEVAQA